MRRYKINFNEEWQQEGDDINQKRPKERFEKLNLHAFVP